MSNIKKDSELIDIQHIYEDIRIKIQDARNKIYKHIDSTAVEVYW